MLHSTHFIPVNYVEVSVFCFLILCSVQWVGGWVGPTRSGRRGEDRFQIQTRISTSTIEPVAILPTVLATWARDSCSDVYTQNSQETGLSHTENCDIRGCSGRQELGTAKILNFCIHAPPMILVGSDVNLFQLHATKVSLSIFTLPSSCTLYESCIQKFPD